VELLSVEYGDFEDLFDGDRPEGVRSACLKMGLSIDPALVRGERVLERIVEALTPLFKGADSVMALGPDSCGELETIAHLTAYIILDLQRDLCEWPAGRYCSCRCLGSEHEYDLYVESIDEHVGLFSAQLAVDVVRMILRQDRFDPHMIWVIDLVRHLRRQPRLRLRPRRVANLLGCSQQSARWAIQALERYGYVFPVRRRRRRRSKGGRVLIVDDSAQVRDLLSRIIELWGYDAITALDGEEGLVLLDWADYRAVFVDLLMPSMDGATFLQRARAQGVSCPIFVVSAYVYRWGASELKAMGATAFVPKPFSVVEIDGLIKKYLR
jgi:CheY-like chemotaxis protein